MKMLIALFMGMVFAAPLYGQANERINYQGTIHTKEYIIVYMPDGRSISVPVINGFLPNIIEYYGNGTWYRTYSYKDVKYVQGTTPYYTSSMPEGPRPIIAKSRPEVRVDPPVSLPSLEESLKSFEEKLKAIALKYEQKKAIFRLPAPNEEIRPGMRKISEFGEPEKRIVPKYSN